MVRSYLKYNQKPPFGIVASPSSNCILDSLQKYAISASLEDVIIWNINTNELVYRWTDPDNQAEVTVIEAISSRHSEIKGDEYAVGYGDGSVRIWSFSGTLKIVFRGHTSPISFISATVDTFLLATGSRDGDIVIWDIIAEVGKAKLKGHRAAISKMAFYNNDILISSSKDSLIKAWDISLQHCFQTILHEHPVSSFILILERGLLVTGSSDSYLRIYSIKTGFSFTDHSSQLLHFLDKIERRVPGKEKIVSMGISNSVFFIQSFDKTIELYRILDEFSLKKKELRRKKRNPDKEGPFVTIADTFLFISTIRSSYKIRSVSMGSSSLSEYKFLVSTFSNSLELWRLFKDENEKIVVELERSVENHGFRSEVNWLSYSNGVLASGSSDCVKLWSITYDNINDGIKSQTSFYPGSFGNATPTVGLLLSNEYLILGDKVGTIYLIHTPTNTLLESHSHTTSGSSILAIQYKLDILITSTSSAVSIWNVNIMTNTCKLVPLALDGIKEALNSIITISLSSDTKFIAVALTDCSVRIYYRDSLKFFLSLYGHKLPVLAMDFSSDNYLIATASADKNMKIWGLDFGDCHKSIFAHSESITGIVWIPKTHLLFTCSKDHTIKYWDGDSFELITTLKGHHAHISAMTISAEGRLLFSAGGSDMSCRLWMRSDEQIFIEDEKDREADEHLVKTMIEDDKMKFDLEGNRLHDDDDDDDHEGDRIVSTPTSIKSLQSIKSSEKLYEVITLVATEAVEIESLSQASALPTFQRTTLLHAYALGLDPLSSINYGPNLLPGSSIVLGIIKKISASDLEQAILMLPLPSLLSLVHIIDEWMTPSFDGGDSLGKAMLGTKIIYLIMLLHSNQLMHCGAIHVALSHIHEKAYSMLQHERAFVGKNIALMKSYLFDLKAKDISIKESTIFTKRSSLG